MLIMAYSGQSNRKKAIKANFEGTKCFWRWKNAISGTLCSNGHSNQSHFMLHQERFTSALWLFFSLKQELFWLYSSATSVGKFSHPGGRTLLLVWHCIVTAVRSLCHLNGRTVPPQLEAFATAVALQCHALGTSNFLRRSWWQGSVCSLNIAAAEQILLKIKKARKKWPNSQKDHKWLTNKKMCLAIYWLFENSNSQNSQNSQQIAKK